MHTTFDAFMFQLKNDFFTDEQLNELQCALADIYAKEWRNKK